MIYLLVVSDFLFCSLFVFSTVAADFFQCVKTITGSFTYKINGAEATVIDWKPSKFNTFVSFPRMVNEYLPLTN